MTKVLLVEDDNNLREIYEARLAAEGYDIVTAKDGEDALAVAKQHKPELIISDVMMPRISGFEMLDILRNTDGLKHVKIIMLTALGQSEDKSRADSLGADRYLVKSQVTLEDIVKAADELLNPDAQEEGIPPSEPQTVTPAPTDSTPATPPQPQVDLPQSAPTPEVTTPAVSEVPVATEPQAPAEEAFPPAMPTIGSGPAEPIIESAQAQTPEPTPVAPAPTAEPASPSSTSPVPVMPDGFATQSEPETAALPTEQPAATPSPLQATEPQTQPVETTVPATDLSAPAVQTEPHTVIQPTSAPQPETTASPINESPVPSPTEAQGIAVIEAPDLGVQAPAPEAEQEAKQKIQMPENPDYNSIDTAQSTTEEASTVDDQINDFVSGATSGITTEATPVEATAPEQTVQANAPAAESGNNDELINSGIDQLATIPATPPEAPAQTVPTQEQGEATPGVSATPTEPATPVTPPQTPTEPTAQAAPTSDQNSQVAGKKIIQPISPPENKADLDTLLQQEEIKDNLANPPMPQAVTGDAPAPQQDTAQVQPAPGVTPVPQQPAQQPGGVFTPNSSGDANMNAL